MRHGHELDAEGMRWTKLSERRPMRKDCDRWGDLLVANANGDKYIIAWYDVMRAEVDMEVTHWMKLPEPPKEDDV